ncbi:class A beta-lactamase [Xylophilus rhododendri]|uniref:beta-lactamase n=1 Tax=Xylophilus rhododendri TaxID=2697032 RepID=A0A857J764_9BURK|nr:class A beta-lactamase [Xylophilus rhododendri]QHI98852.1 class A beta-lactamase [Xylophilus rhododendri]
MDTRRRACLAAALSLPWLGTAHAQGDDPVVGLAELESAYGGRLGLALTSAGRPLLSYRADERFPACSTFKALLAATVLNRASSDPGLLGRRVMYGQADLKTYAPVTGRLVDQGMTISHLCAAAVQYSDNVAANLLMREIGGPAGVTAFARWLRDDSFRLDRWEPELNSAIPGDPRDTCTPRDMARNLHKLVLGQALPARERELLKSWLLGNTTGNGRIRASVPENWPVGDKTGTGEYGSTNDIAVIWPADGPPLVLAIYFTQFQADAQAREEVIVEATRLALAVRR